MTVARGRGAAVAPAPHPSVAELNLDALPPEVGALLRDLGMGEDEGSPALDEAYWVMQQAVSMVVKQIPQQATASDLMSTAITALKPTDSMADALSLMDSKRKRAVPVVGDGNVLLGYIKYRDPIKAAQTGKAEQQVKAWVRRELITIQPEASFTEMEELLLEGSTGRLHVIDDDRRLLGIVTRTDVLGYYQHYKDMTG